MKHSFRTGIRIGLTQWRVAALVYLLPLLIGAVFGLQLSSLFKTTIGDSLSLDFLLQGYDHSVMSDFFNAHGDAFGVLIEELRWIMLLFLILSIFLKAGKYSAILRQELFWPEFIQGGMRYFGSFFWIALIQAGATIIWTLICWLPVIPNLFSALESFPTEDHLLWFVLFILTIYGAGMLILSQIGILSRTHLITAEVGIWQSYKAAFGWMRQHFWANNGLYVLFLGLQLIVGLVYLFLESQLGMVSTITVYTFLLIQQAYSFARTIMNFMTIGGMSDYYLSLVDKN